ncbi:MAG TPA: acyl carrier protein [Streptosporangiaceae bacterium]|nr:acyl carrier protein [Streptosporangiaceae bacterium]
MPAFTFDDLKQALRAAAGEDESVSLDSDILDTEFAELGYDSLAILETASHVERGFGVRLPEDEVGDKQTPRAFIDFVNSILSAKV